MTLLYADDQFLKHDTGDHPESPERLLAIHQIMSKVPLKGQIVRPNWELVTPDQIALAHNADLAPLVRKFAQQGGGRIEADTILSLESFDVASLAAGAVFDAVNRVVAGEDTSALCLVRPPGHHATPSQSMGFCLFNNVAIGAVHATRDLGLNRVLIVDWDVHHGNGTQDIFWRNEQVGFYSAHRYPFYPGTGDSLETGEGAGLGYTLNFPVPYGTSREDYLAGFQAKLERISAKVQPELVLISAGFDAHREDPVGDLGLEVEDFTTLTAMVRNVANQYCDGRLVSVLEGGYHPERLAESVLAHLRALVE